MDFRERFKTVFGGVKNLATAPIGAMIDIVQAINPFDDKDFTGEELKESLTTEAMQGIGGVTDVYQASGLKGAFSHVPWLTKTIGNFFDEAELLWNHQYQEDTESQPWVFDQSNKLLGTDIQPGDVSMSKGIAAAGGLAGGIAGELGRTVNPNQTGNLFQPSIYDVGAMIRESENTSIGQMVYERTFALSELPEDKQAEIKNTSAYVLTTGTIDAIARWKFDPLIVGGKTIKKTRETRGAFMGVDRIYGNAKKKIERTLGREIKGLDDVASESRAFDGELGPALKEGENMYLIMDADEAKAAGLFDNELNLNLRDGDGVINEFSPMAGRSNAIIEQAKKQLPPDSPILEWGVGGDIYHYQNISKNIDTASTQSRELFDFFFGELQGQKGIQKIRQILNPESNKMPNPNDLKLAFKYIDENWNPWVENSSIGRYGKAKFGEGEFSQAIKGMAKEDGISLGRFGGYEKGGMYAGKFFDLSPTRAKEIITEMFLRKIDEANPSASSFTTRTASRLGEQIQAGEKGKIIFRDPDTAIAAAKADASWRQANKKSEASLGQFDIDNPTIIVEIDPQGLPVIIPRWDPDGGWVLTDVNQIGKEAIRSKRLYNAKDFDEAGELPMSFWNDKSGMQTPRLFEDLDEARVANEKILRVYGDDNGGAAVTEQMISNDIMRKEYGETGLLNDLVNHQRVKTAVEIMEGKKSGGFGKAKKLSASEIYDYFFKDAPGGDLAASLLAKADGVEAKSEVLLALMGVRMPKQIKGLTGELIDDLHKLNMDQQLMKDRIKSLKKIAKESDENMADKHVQFFRDIEDAHTFDNHVKTYAGMEKISPNQLRTLQKIDEFIESKFPDRNHKTSVEEYLKMNPDEAEKAMLDLELQEAFLKKQNILIDGTEGDLRQAIKLAQQEEVFGILRDVPYATLGKKLSYQLRNSNIYRNSALTKPIRSITEFSPRQWLNISDSAGHLQIDRFLKEANARWFTKGSDPLFSVAEITKYRNMYLSAGRDVDKFQNILNLTEEVLKRVGKREGLDASEITTMINSMKKGTRNTHSFLESRRYSPKASQTMREAMIGQSDEVLESVRKADKGFYGDEISYMDFDTGEHVIRTMPLLSTQLSNWVPLTDLKQLKSVLSSQAGLRKYGRGVIEGAEAFGDSIYSVWKPSVLLRGGWPIRFVGDEQLRIFARGISIADHILALSKTGDGFYNKNLFWTNDITKALKEGQRAEAIGAAAGVLITSPIRLGTQGLTMLAKILAPFVKMSKRGKRLSSYMDELGPELEPLVSARAGYATPNDNMVSQYGAFMSKQEQGIFNKYSNNRKSGQFAEYNKNDPEYATSWLRGLKNQIMQDDLGRMSVRTLNKAIDEVAERGPITQEAIIVEWQKLMYKDMRNYMKSEKGVGLKNQMPWRTEAYKGGRWIEDWADDIIDMVAQYSTFSTGGTSASTIKFIRQLGRNKLSSKTLNEIPAQHRPATVHGEAINQVLGSNFGPAKALKAFVQEGFEGFGKLPSDVLSRNPMLKNLIAREVDRRVNLMIKQGKKDFTSAEIQRVVRQAKRGAIQETQKWMYNIAESPRLGDTMVRFLIPFFGANVEILRVWSGLSARDPSILRKAQLIWQSPNKAVNPPGGLLEGAGANYTIITKDDEGNEYLTFNVSESYKEDKDWYGWKKYAADATYKFNKKSFNMVTQNPIGNGGPILQVAMNELAIRDPELYKTDFGQFVLSWGVKGGTSIGGRLLAQQSNSVKYIAENMNLSGDYNSKYQKLWNEVSQWHHVMYGMGEVPPQSPEEIQSHAMSLFHLYSWITYYSPASPIVESPLQPYKTAYQELLDQFGFVEGTEKFIQTYGYEYFALTIGKTTSQTGLAPTQETEQARQPFKNTLKTYPEYADVILGDTYDVGEFDSAVYAAQQSSTVDRDFSDDMLNLYGPEREYKDFTAEDFLPDGRRKDIDIKTGWDKYGRLMDEVYSILYENELTSLRQWPELLAYKDEEMDKIKEEHPAWADEKDNIGDVNKWDKKMIALEEIVTAVLVPEVTKDISTRPDLVALAIYLARRKEIQDLIAESDYKTLDAQGNRDLKNQYLEMVDALLDKYPEFVSIYYRYLEGDKIKASK